MRKSGSRMLASGELSAAPRLRRARVSPTKGQWGSRFQPKKEVQRMKGKRVPDEVVNAINLLLAPFDIKLDIEAIKALRKQRTTPAREKEDSRILLSIAEVSELYRMSRWALYRAIRSGELQNTIKLGRARSARVLIPRRELERYFKSKLLKLK